VAQNQLREAIVKTRHPGLLLLLCCQAALGCGSNDPDQTRDAGVTDATLAAAADGWAAEARAIAPSSTPREICKSFLACTAAVIPEGLLPAAQTYGADGVCWKTLDEAACGKACLSSMQKMHKAYPSQAACLECIGAADCPDPRAAFCAANRCVQCRSKSDCPSSQPACLSSGQCGPCARDSDCGGATPVCDYGTCALCAPGRGCGAGQVCTASRSCCTPKKCSADLCGSQYDGCGGSLSCGACKSGMTCFDGKCSTVGQLCTPAVTQCSAGQVCAYDAWSQKYRCAFNAAGKGCTDPGGGMDTCGVAITDPSTGLSYLPLQAFDCQGGKCVETCLASSGYCGSGGTCKKPSWDPQSPWGDCL